MGGPTTPDTTAQRLWLTLAIGSSIAFILMASVYDSWTDGERDAFKDGFHSCKEGLPPSRGNIFEDPFECEAWYEGYWRALESNKAKGAVAAFLVTGLLALWLRRK
jgi:hypothetical protein